MTVLSRLAGGLLSSAPGNNDGRQPSASCELSSPKAVLVSATNGRNRGQSVRQLVLTRIPCSINPMNETLSAKKISGGVVHDFPADLKKALTSDAKALETWEDITPLARNEWICWIQWARRLKQELIGSNRPVPASETESGDRVVGRAVGIVEIIATPNTHVLHLSFIKPDQHTCNRILRKSDPDGWRTELRKEFCKLEIQNNHAGHGHRSSIGRKRRRRFLRSPVGSLPASG